MDDGGERNDQSQMETLRSEGKIQPFCFGINKVISPPIDC